MRDWATVTESELLHGVCVARNDAERVTLRELIERYRRDTLPTLRGVGHVSHLRRLDEAFGQRPLARITPAKVAAYRDQRLHDEKAASTVTKELATLSVLFKLASREWVSRARRREFHAPVEIEAIAHSRGATPCPNVNSNSHAPSRICIAPMS